MKLLIFLVLNASILAATFAGGLQPQLVGRIVDGQPTTISSMPWQVSIQYAGQHRCGGSIYSPKVVVTAAHCMVGFWFYFRVRAGSSLWISGGVLAEIDDYKKHQLFNFTTYDNDIAVILLSISLSWSPNIKPIRLAYREPENGAAAFTSGWGSTHYLAQSMPTQLKFVQLQILNRSECNDFDEEITGMVTKSMICAHAVGKDACKGDSGGPLVSDGVLVGVVSAGLNCGFYPGFYTNVAALRSWIVRNAELISKN